MEVFAYFIGSRDAVAQTFANKMARSEPQKKVVNCAMQWRYLLASAMTLLILLEVEIDVSSHDVNFCQQDGKKRTAAEDGRLCDAVQVFAYFIGSRDADRYLELWRKLLPIRWPEVNPRTRWPTA